MKFNIKKVAAAFLSVAMLTTGSAQLSVFAQQTLKYEAENGTLGGSALSKQTAPHQALGQLVFQTQAAHGHRLLQSAKADTTK